MKHILPVVVLSVLLIAASWNKIVYNFGPQPDLSNLKENDVVLYATSWCGYCAKMRTFLGERNIPYFEIDIETSREGYQQYSDYGGKGIPLTVVKGQVIQGYNPKAVLKALDNATP